VQQPVSSLQATNSNSDNDVQKTIQSTVQQAQQITQNAATQNSGTDSNVVSRDTKLNGSIIRFNGKVFIAENNGQMIEAPGLEHLVGQQIVNGQITTSDDSSMLAAQRNNIAATNALIAPRMPFINGQNPINNMMIPNQGFFPPGQAPIQQPLPFPGQMQPNPMQNAIFQNRQFMFQNGRVPMPQNMIGQFAVQRPPLPFQQRQLLRRPPPMRPPIFPGPRGMFRQGPPGRQFGKV
jgi:hypothetical protein